MFSINKSIFVGFFIFLIAWVLKLLVYTVYIYKERESVSDWLHFL